MEEEMKKLDRKEEAGDKLSDDDEPVADDEDYNMVTTYRGIESVFMSINLNDMIMGINLLFSPFLSKLTMRSCTSAAVLKHQGTYSYAQMADIRNRTFVCVVQLMFMYLMSAIQLMDWNLFYYPHWTLQGAFFGNSLGILLVTAFFYYPRH